MKNRLSLAYSPTPFIAALLVGLVLLVATQLPKPGGDAPGAGSSGSGNSRGSFVAPQEQQVVIDRLQSSPGLLSGSFSGEVKLDWTLVGVYSDTLATPTKQPTLTPSPADLGWIDLGVQLAQIGTRVSGFVDLQETLVYTKEATILATPVQPTPAPGSPTPGATPLAIGPTVDGRLNGATLQLQSSRVRGILAGVPIQRQFRLNGVTAWADDMVTISGEYRETIWGYVPQPLTLIGRFELRQPLYLKADGEFGQWATTATSSSEWSNPDWSATQATGAPNLETCSDNALPGRQALLAQSRNGCGLAMPPRCTPGPCVCVKRGCPGRSKASIWWSPTGPCTRCRSRRTRPPALASLWSPSLKPLTSWSR
jgi:hypothetical protein